MIRKILLSASLLTAGLCLAAPITPEEALSRVSGDGLILGTRGAESPQLARIYKTPKGEPAVYLFEAKANPGFMIVSADDAVTPLLGYSDFNSLDPENISPAMQSWLDQYVNQIEFARKNPEMGASGGTSIKLPDWTPISPMVKTQWNQNAPYFNQCPTYNGQYCYTGCVATSMAQLMNYFQYPEKGQGSITYNCTTLNRTLSVDFSDITFDWRNMLNSYSGTYTDIQANAVATLMMAAGYSVQMGYSLNTSGAVSGLISGALVKYFGYDNQAFYAVRDLYQYTDWATMIYNNLRNVGPVIYDGNSSSGGHSFICDGYRGDGYFHFNWGWGGSGDGYFLLDALNPSSLGIGAGNGGYNFDQDCLLNIQKPRGDQNQPTQSMMIIYGSAEGYFDNSLLTFNLVDGPQRTDGTSMLGWSFKGIDTLVADLGAIFEPLDSQAETLYATSTNSYNKNQEFNPMSYMPIEGSNGMSMVSLRPSFRLSNLNLVKGVKYKVISAYLPRNTEDWLTVQAASGSYNYFCITKTGDGTSESDYEIENYSPMQFVCDNLSFDAQLYNGIAAQLSASITNKNDIELTRAVELVLYDESGRLRYTGDTFVISLAPGETYKQSWTTVLTAKTNLNVSKELSLYAGLFDPETSTTYYMSETPVTMEPNPGTPRYTTNLKIDDAEYSSKKYYVENSSNFVVDYSIDVTRNIFSNNITLWIANMENNYYYKLLSYIVEPLVVEAGSTGTVKMNMSFPDAVIGETYYVVALINDNFDKSVPFVALANGAGVEEIISSDKEPVIFFDKAMGKVYVQDNGTGIKAIETYSINGMKLAPQVDYNGDNATIDLSSLGKGIVVVTVVDGQGHRKTAKLAL